MFFLKDQFFHLSRCTWLWIFRHLSVKHDYGSFGICQLHMTMDLLASVKMHMTMDLLTSVGYTWLWIFRHLSVTHDYGSFDICRLHMTMDLSASVSCTWLWIFWHQSFAHDYGSFDICQLHMNTNLVIAISCLLLRIITSKCLYSQAIHSLTFTSKYCSTHAVTLVLMMLQFHDKFCQLSAVYV